MDFSQTRYYRFLYYEIINGYSCVFWNKQNLFIKHIDPSIQGLIDKEYQTVKEAARLAGLISEKDSLIFLDKEGLWTNKDETKLKNQREYILGLQQAQKNLMIPRQINEQKKIIQEEEAKYITLSQQKEKLLGETIESYSEKKINHLYLLHSFYKDEYLNNLLFTKEGFNEINGSDYLSLQSVYNRTITEFKTFNIQKIAISGFFQNLYYSCEDNPLIFYGKPITKLTFYQNELLNWGRYFKNILSSENTPPDNIADDPEKLISWFTGAKNVQSKLDQNNDGKAISIVGATKQDLKDLGLDQNVVSLGKKAKEKNKGVLEFKDILALDK